jgi:hypothetical protein
VLSACSRQDAHSDIYFYDVRQNLLYRKSYLDTLTIPEHRASSKYQTRYLSDHDIFTWIIYSIPINLHLLLDLLAQAPVGDTRLPEHFIALEVLEQDDRIQENPKRQERNVCLMYSVKYPLDRLLL